MKVLIVAIYDSKIQQYSAPSFTLNRGSALRGWEEMANDQKSDASKYPADFTPFELGYWYPDTGTIEMFSAKFSLGTALEFQKGSPRPSVPISPNDLTPNPEMVTQ